MDTIVRRIAKQDVHTLILAAAIALALAVMAVTVPDRFLNADNFASMSVQLSELGLFSIAMALSLLIGGIDLSVVAVANLAAISAAFVIRLAAGPEAGVASAGLALLAGAGTALFIGLGVGLVNGLLVTRLGVPSILATLGTMTLFTGISFGVTNGSAVSGVPEKLVSLGNAGLLGLPVPFVAFLLLALGVDFVLRRTALGAAVLLTGTSAKVARFSGIPTHRVVIATHLATAGIASVAGLIHLLRTNSANADYGGTYVLLAILVSVLGGVSVAGGKGRVLGVLLSLVLLQILSTGFNMVLLYVSDGSFFRDLVWGALLLVIMSVTQRWRRAQG